METILSSRTVQTQEEGCIGTIGHGLPMTFCVGKEYYHMRSFKCEDVGLKKPNLQSC